MCPTGEEPFASCALASRRLSEAERRCGAAASCQPHQLSLRYLILCSHTSRHICLSHFFLSSLCPEGWLLWLITYSSILNSPCSLTLEPVTVTLLWRHGHWQYTLLPCVPQCVVSCEEMRCHELSWAELSWCAVMQWNSSLTKRSLPQLHEAKLNESWEVPRTPVNLCLIRFSIIFGQLNTPNVEVK